MFRLALAVTALFLANACAGVMAQGMVAQDGREVARVRQTLQGIKLPPGFRIELYALVPGARSLAVGPAGAVFVGTRGARVYVVKAGAVRVFAPSVRFRDPNGVCFSREGVLYVVEQNRVLSFLAPEEAEARVGTVVPQGALIPVSEQSSNHGARVCRVGPDDKLYVALGQPYNVPPRTRLGLFSDWGIGGIVRMGRDGANRYVFVRGIRNSVGMDFDPRSGDLWFTDNQVDGMGDDIPPGEINHATRAGQNFGFPWYGGGHTRTKEYAGETPPEGVVFPAVEEVAHAADLGMMFYRGTMVPAKYRGAIFSAQHGSWNRTTPVGARVMVTLATPDGMATWSEPFAAGWLDEATGTYSGRPVDVAALADGSLLVSDDDAGAIYRISYDGRR